MALQKQKILDVAVGLFSKKGYRATSLDDIAKQLSVSYPSLYYYFKSKNEILSEIYRQHYYMLEIQMQEIMKAQSPPREKLKALLVRWIKYISTSPIAFMVRVTISEKRELPQRERKKMIERERQILNSVVQIYEEGVQKGDFIQGDTKLTCLLLIGACNSIANWYDEKGRLNPDQLAAYSANLLERIWLVKE